MCAWFLSQYSAKLKPCLVSITREISIRRVSTRKIQNLNTLRITKGQTTQDIKKSVRTFFTVTVLGFLQVTITLIDPFPARPIYQVRRVNDKDTYNTYKYHLSTHKHIHTYTCYFEDKIIFYWIYIPAWFKTLKFKT